MCFVSASLHFSSLIPKSLSVPLSASPRPSCSLQSWSSALKIPAQMKPLTRSWGFSEKYSAIWISHFAPSSFRIGSPKLTGSMFGKSLSFPSNCDITWCAYHSSKHLIKKSFAGLFTEKSMGWSKSVVFDGNRLTWMLWPSKRSVIPLEIWRLKLSRMTKAEVSASKVCQLAFTYGMMMCSKYWNMVCSLDQCFGEWVMF